jgi:hypothetical protein
LKKPNRKNIRIIRKYMLWKKYWKNEYRKPMGSLLETCIEITYRKVIRMNERKPR